MKPLFIVKYDDSKYWDKTIIEKANKIYSYYLIDTSKICYNCSIIPTFESYHLLNQIENYNNFDDEELFELENSINNDVEYIECKYFDKKLSKRLKYDKKDIIMLGIDRIIEDIKVNIGYYL